MVLSEEMQNLVGVLLKMAETITNTMNMILPAVGQLQTHMLSIQDRNLVANNEFNEVCLCYCTVTCQSPTMYSHVCLCLKQRNAVSVLKIYL